MATSEQVLRERVRRAIEEELRDVVDEVLDDAIRGLVRERVGALNGTAEPELEPAAPGTKRCNGCGQTKSLDQFEAGRGRCRSCRRGDQEQRLARREAENANGAPAVEAAAPAPFE